MPRLHQILPPLQQNRTICLIGSQRLSLKRNLALRISGVCSAILINHSLSSISLANLWTGPSSGLSLFSPQGLQWVAERTGTNELQEFVSELAKAQPASLSSSQIQLWNPVPPERRAPLPPREMADVYIRRMQFLPLFRQFQLTIQSRLLWIFEYRYAIIPSRELYATVRTAIFSQPSCGSSLVCIIEHRLCHWRNGYITWRK